MDVDEIVDRVVEVLEPNAVYYDHGAHGERRERFFPIPELLFGLGLFLTGLVLPVLSNVLSSNVLNEDLNGCLPNRHHTRSGPLDADIQAAVQMAARAARPQLEARSAAVDAVASVLEQYGWPHALAAADATEIVRQIEQSVWGGGDA